MVGQLLRGRVNASEPTRPGWGRKHPARMAHGWAWRWLLLFGLLATAAQADRTGLSHLAPTDAWVGFPELRFQRGDDPAWARADYDDSAWTRLPANRLPSHDGVYWVRLRVRREPGEAERDAVIVAVVASYEIFWDGRRIGHSGVVGRTRAEEVAGPLDNVFRIPDELAGPGEHVIALRLSSQRTGFRLPVYTLNLVVYSVREYLEFRTRASVAAVLAMGGALVAGLGLALYWLLVDRRLAPALFGAACLCMATMQGLITWRGLYDYPYYWHSVRVLLIALSLGLLGILLVAWMAAFFRLKRPWLPVVAVAGLMTAAWSDERIIAWMAAISLTLAITLAVVGLRARRRGAGWVLAGLLVSAATLAASPAEFLDQPVLLNLGAPLIGGLAAQVLQLRDDRRVAERAQLTAARLEVELLKKNIQPHFLLNTLTTLSEIIEQEPAAAVDLIEALAAEFRLLVRVAGERLIPVADELELCRGHLRVMSLRQRVGYTLVTSGTEEDARVPPALFLTLVENGITHGRARSGTVEFRLAATRLGTAERYELRTPLPPGGVRPVRPAGADGTGLRYVKARLEESFPGAWRLTSAPAEGHWLVGVEWDSAESTGGRG